MRLELLRRLLRRLRPFVRRPLLRLHLRRVPANFSPPPEGPEGFRRFSGSPGSALRSASASSFSSSSRSRSYAARRLAPSSASLSLSSFSLNFASSSSLALGSGAARDVSATAPAARSST